MSTKNKTLLKAVISVAALSLITILILNSRPSANAGGPTLPADEIVASETSETGTTKAAQTDAQDSSTDLQSNSSAAKENTATDIDSKRTVGLIMPVPMGSVSEASLHSVIAVSKHQAARLLRAAYEESDAEKLIYSYVQVPEGYYDVEEWIGDWTHLEAGGQEFFYFGCGICCLSNMYSTFYQTPVTPDVMFELTKANTDYYPDSGKGAVSWTQLKQMCVLFEIPSEVKQKPYDYSAFQYDVMTADTTMVLVCKDNDDKLWYYTKGHYVNLWEYDPVTDTVFVTDASGMFNRARVNLRDIYNALKTASDAQYMVAFRPVGQESTVVNATDTYAAIVNKAN